jgi:hypothetical protein
MRALVAALLALAAGCYDTPEPDCAFQCGEDDACPDDYGCATDGWCKRIDLPDDHVCPAGTPLEVGPAAAAEAEALESPIAPAITPPAKAVAPAAR